MKFGLSTLLISSERFAPPGSTRRKLIQVFAVILVFQGIIVVLRPSHTAPMWGALSIILGVTIFALFPPRYTPAKEEVKVVQKGPLPETYGVVLVAVLVRIIGGKYVVMGLGAAIMTAVIVFNQIFSQRPDYGDLDTLSFMLGAVLVVYPFAVDKFKIEVTFALLFIGLVVVLLVVPQAFMATGDGSGSAAGNWYVHYMLAAPMAGTLNLLGIPASSHSEWVTITFSDGMPHTIGISTACAGLYSFSIFVSAFFSFTLVFERLPARLMAFVLGVGLLAAYLGNLFRMVVIGIVGYYKGMDALLWAHDNVGWMVFLGWSAVFWYLVIRYADKRVHRSVESKNQGAA